jgi:hypothetical protein
VAAPSNEDLIQLVEAEQEGSWAARGDEAIGSSSEDLPFHPAVGCLLSVAIGLVAVALLFGLARLLSEDELRFGGGELTPNRLWLIRDGENQGLAYSTGRVVERGEDADRVCVETQVRFVLWKADTPFDPIRYCDCYLRQGSQWQYTEPCGGALP